MIPNAIKRISVHFADGNTRQIMQIIMSVVNKDYLESQVEDFALTLLEQNRGDKKKTLKAIWRIVRKEVEYIADGYGVQDIKHPARTWHDGYGDCKSMSIFIYYCCRALDIPCFIRFVSYLKDKEIGHVYPIAVLDNKQVILDAVYEYFDAEIEYTHKIDKYSKVYNKSKIKTAMTQIREISGIKGASGYSRDQLQDMTMTLQQKGKLTLPKSPRYNLSQDSEAMILAQLQAEKFNKLGLIARAKGDQSRAGQQFRMRDELLKLGQRSIHQNGASLINTSGLSSLAASNLKSFASKIQILESVAIHSAINKLPIRKESRSIAGPYDIYNPTQAQLTACNQIATERVLDFYGNIDYEAGWTFNSAVYDTCRTGKFMENLVNDKLASAGSTFALHLMPRDFRYYAHISNKRDRQTAWALAISEATGLSLAIIEGYLDNGVVNDNEADALEIHGSLQYAMTPGHTAIGEPLTAATIAAIIKIVSVLANAAAVAAIRTAQIKAAAESKKQNAFNVVQDIPQSLLQVNEDDFDTSFPNGGGGSNGGGNTGGGSNSSGSGFGTTEIALGGAALYFLLKD